MLWILAGVPAEVAAEKPRLIFDLLSPLWHRVYGVGREDVEVSQTSDALTVFCKKTVSSPYLVVGSVRAGGAEKAAAVRVWVSRVGMKI